MFMLMRKFFLIFFILFCTSIECYSVGIKPDCLISSQTPNYEIVNETAAIIFNKIKLHIRTNKYPKYFHDFTLIKDDGTQSHAYKYSFNSGAELMFGADTNELKYVSFRRPELQKCRIMYEYPSGKLYAVQVFVENESFIFDPDGKYVDYAPYVAEVNEKVKENWKVPSRKDIEKVAGDKKDLLVQLAVTVAKNGSVKKIFVLKSSQINTLDENAKNAVKSASPFKPFPQNFFNDELVITLNFNFSL